MSTRRYGQRAVEQQRWQQFHYISDYGDLPIRTKRTLIDDRGRETPLLSPQEINGASNTTIILTRMLQKGKIAWLKRTMR